MARLRDLPVVYQKVGVWQFLKNVWARINADNLYTWASALAYSWLFALFPFFLILMTMLPYLPEDWKVQAEEQIRYAVDQLPQEAAQTVWVNLAPKIKQLLYNPPTGLFSISVILTLWAASSGMNMTMLALDHCYDVTEYRPFYIQRPLAIFVTVVVVTLILLVLALLPIGTLATNLATAWLSDKELHQLLPLLWLWQVARYLLGLALMLTILAVIYYFGPNVEKRWHWISPGAIFSIVVWILLGAVFRLYIDRFGKYNQTYGTVGGVAVLLLLFYIDALVLLVGAEINSQVDKAAGSRQ